MTGMTPSDIDVAEVHDFAPGVEVMISEDRACSGRFEAANKSTKAKVTSVGGALHARPSGGQLAKSHLPRAIGLAQRLELCQQRGAHPANRGRSIAVATIVIVAGSGI